MSYPTTEPGQIVSPTIRPGDYDGISHARLTRTMTQARLPATARVLMAEIFRCIPIGTWRHISHDTLRQRLGMSESTVSRGVALLAGELLDAAGLPLNRTSFIARRLRQNGKPGYELCPLPPPELRPRLVRVAHTTEPDAEPVPARQMAFFTPLISDPVGSIPLQGVPMPQTDPPKGSTVDPSIIIDQTCKQQACAHARTETQTDNPPEPVSAPTQPIHVPPAGAPPRPIHVPPAARCDLPEVMPSQFADLHLHPHHWRALRAAAPDGYGVPELARDILKLRTRHDPRSWFRVLCACLTRREPVYGQAELDAQNAEFAALCGPTEEPAHAERRHPGTHGSHRPRPSGSAADRAAAGSPARLPDRPEPTAAAHQPDGLEPERPAPVLLSPERIAEIRARTLAALHDKQQRRC